MLVKYHRIIGIIIITLVVVLNVVAYFILPDVLIMQITLNGEAGTTMPKIVGLSINLVLGVGSGYFLIKTDESTLQRWFVISLIILAVNFFAIFINI